MLLYILPFLQPEVAVKSDECLTDLKSQSQSMVPPLVIEPPTPPDNIRGADSNAATPKFFQPNLSPDGSVSSDGANKLLLVYIIHINLNEIYRLELFSGINI